MEAYKMNQIERETIKPFKPAPGEIYYYIDSVGDIKKAEFNTKGGQNERVRHGNCFESFEDAGIARSAIQSAHNEMQSEAHPTKEEVEQGGHWYLESDTTITHELAKSSHYDEARAHQRVEFGNSYKTWDQIVSASKNIRALLANLQLIDDEIPLESMRVKAR
jgi:hypothetical protein